MKRPIAELRTVMVHAGGEAEWLRAEHEAWQILRRKPGYIAHHLYQAVHAPQQRLVYSEWESTKALEGARHFIQGTPLGRRARSALDAQPERMIVELVGPVTSTKGLDLPQTAIAATAVTRLSDADADAHEQHTKLGKFLANQPGHITHVLFRGFNNPALVGAFSHWTDMTSFEKAITSVNGLGASESLQELVHVQYDPLKT